MTLIAVDKMTDAHWDILDAADAIVFGSATYMGNVSAAFQAFAEQTGRRCLNGTWRDKEAAGFTNSGAKSGDKMHTLTSLAVFAAQHHMHWVNLGLGAGWNSSAGSEDDLGRRVALVTRQLNVGRAASPAASSLAAGSAPAR